MKEYVSGNNCVEKRIDLQDEDKQHEMRILIEGFIRRMRNEIDKLEADCVENESAGELHRKTALVLINLSHYIGSYHSNVASCLKVK